MSDVVTDAWAGCYNDSWQGLITPESFAHPAKMSLGLLRRIFAHAKAEGWLQPKSVVLDPFAGIGTTALEALLNGCAFQGCELEPRFFMLAQANIAQWIHDYRHLQNFGPWAMVVNGDSRRLLEHIPAQHGCAISSPPYAEGWHKAESTAVTEDRMRKAGYSEDYIARQFRASKASGGNLNATDYGSSPGQLGAMAVSSPPYAGTPIAHTEGNIGGGPGGRKASAETTVSGNIKQVGYGGTEGNLASLAVASPPYAGAGEVLGAHNGIDWSKVTDGGKQATPGRMMQPYGTSEGQMCQMAVSSPPYGDQQVGTGADGRTGWRGYTDHGGGTSAMDGQMAAMPTLSVSSPPYADGCDQKGRDKHPERMVGSRTGYLQKDHAGYGESQGQLADELPNNFWAASATILAQTFALLRPGGHAIFVTKRYVRAGKIVEFTQDWIRCCQSVGFQLLHRHKAMLVEHHGTQTTLFGEGDTVHETRRESFFRRLARMKGSPAIEWEDVTCFVKPDGESGSVDLCAASPPYNLPMSQDHNGSKGGTRGTTPSERGAFVQYGTTPGQLEGMPMGDAVISSPPYSVGLGKEHTYADPAKRENDSHRRIMREKHIADPFYGSSEGNLGNMPAPPCLHVDTVPVDGERVCWRCGEILGAVD